MINKTTVKVKPKTRDKLNTLSRELSALEDGRVTVPEVLDRIFGGGDIVTRLKQGSIERRMRKNRP